MSRSHEHAASCSEKFFLHETVRTPARFVLMMFRDIFLSVANQIAPEDAV
jgi:hypothetical protein